VLVTGPSHLPEDEEPGGQHGEVADIDLGLDDPDRPAETLDSWVQERVDRMRYADLVRAGMRRWRVSESTMKRRIADAKKEQP
jgi:hypothetical protein